LRSMSIKDIELIASRTFIPKKEQRKLDNLARLFTEFGSVSELYGNVAEFARFTVMSGGFSIC